MAFDKQQVNWAVILVRDYDPTHGWTHEVPIGGHLPQTHCTASDSAPHNAEDEGGVSAQTSSLLEHFIELYIDLYIWRGIIIVSISL